MPLVVGENSYVTIAEADAYFTGRPNADAWDALSGTEKEALLITACRRLEMLQVRGIKADLKQKMQFPRNIYSYSYHRMEKEEAVSDNVKYAQIEEAMTLYVGGAEASMRADLQQQGVTSISILSLSETYGGSNVSGGSGNSAKLSSAEADRYMSDYTGGVRFFA